MFNALTGLGYGIVIFAVTLGVGTIILYSFKGAIAGCGNSALASTAAGYGFWNSTGETCSNLTASYTPSTAGYTNVNYLQGQLGTAGLAGWAPAIIAFAVGMLFLGAFMIGGGNKQRQY